MFTPSEIQFLFQRASLPIAPTDADGMQTMHIAQSCLQKLEGLFQQSQIPEGRTIAPAEAEVLATAAKNGKKIKLAEGVKAEAAG